MTELLKKIVLLTGITLSALAFTACEDNDAEDAFEDTGDAIEEGVENVGDGVEDAVN